MITNPTILASAAESGSGESGGGLDLKLFQEPLLPIAGTAVDLTPFVLMFVMLSVSSLCIRVRTGPAWLAAGAQSLAAGVWGMIVVLMGRALVDSDTLVSLDNILVVGTLGLFTFAWLLTFWETTGVRQSFRLASQTCSFAAFVLSIHPCACMVRDAMYGLRFLNNDNMRAFEFLIVIVTVSAFTMVWGRSFCGWVCPIGFVQELTTRLATFGRGLAGPRTGQVIRWTACLVFLAAVVAGYLFLGPAQLPFYQGMLVFWVIALLIVTLMVINNPRLERRLRPIRYASLILFAGTIYLGTYLNGVFCVLLKNILAKPTVILFVGVLFTTLVLSQAWCRFLCPEGAWLGWLTRLSGWKIALEKSKCSACNICNDVCPVQGIEVGRVVEDVCLYCCKCIDHCPTDALSMDRPAPGLVPLPMAGIAATRSGA